MTSIKTGELAPGPTSIVPLNVLTDKLNRDPLCVCCSVKAGTAQQRGAVLRERGKNVAGDFAGKTKCSFAICSSV